MYYKMTKSGFTVIELLVVIAIIGVLATLGIVAFGYARNYAKVTKALADMGQIEKAINMLSNDCGSWPGHQAPNQIGTDGNEICNDGCAYGLDDQLSGIAVSDGSYINWGGPYMELIPKDPWDHNFFFDSNYQVKADGSPCDGSATCISAVVLGSYGPDGAGNNQYNADDVIKIIYK
jgi:prepilin-type N-terminal cleavage/methylation domain-containing protein